MTIFRRRLFWKIYLTLLASLVVTIMLMGSLFWFLGEAQREGPPPDAGRHRGGPHDVSLYDSDGRLISARGPVIPMPTGDERHWGPPRIQKLDLPDGRIAVARVGPPMRARAVRFLTSMLVVLGAIGLAAYPVTTLLTRRLEALRAGMARWGESAEPVRVDERGHDEVALLARTFNTAATRIDALLRSQKALLANASHELRSPLARLRVAIEMDGLRTSLSRHTEILRNLDEMDQLVGELLLSSRLDHADGHRGSLEAVDLLGLAAEEAARCDAGVCGETAEIVGDAVLLRRMIRNLLENAKKHGRPPIEVAVARHGAGAEIVVSDAGRGVSVAERERIFEPFYRPAGSTEADGGWGLGLALVRQIVERHGGSVTCETGSEGGTRFTVRVGQV